MIPFCVFFNVSHAVVSGTYAWMAPYPLPKLDQKVISRWAEYDKVIRGTPCSALPWAPPALSPPLAFNAYFSFRDCCLRGWWSVVINTTVRTLHFCNQAQNCWCNPAASTTICF